MVAVSLVVVADDFVVNDDEGIEAIREVVVIVG